MKIVKRHRRVFGVLLLLSLAGSGSSCARQENFRQRVLRFLSTTDRIERAFTYSENIAGETVRVEGRIKDGFRYQEIVELGGQQVLEHIVDDDAVAVRVMVPDMVPGLLPGGSLASSIPVLSDTLRSGQWVIDPSGAPPIRKQQIDPDAYVPSDPLRDPIEVIRYVRAAVASAQDIKQWQEDDINPAYRAKEDNFPKPDAKGGVKRYDLLRPSVIGLIRPTGPGGGVGQVEARTFHFRKMAIYVKGERVVKILEEIDVTGHVDVKEAVEKGRDRAIALVKSVKEGRTREKIKLRKMSIEFSDFGHVEDVRRPESGLLAGLKAFFGTDATSGGNIFGFGPQIQAVVTGPVIPGAPGGTEESEPAAGGESGPAPSPASEGGSP